MASVSDRILNLANPSESGSALPGIIANTSNSLQNNGVTNTSRINNLLAEAITNAPWTSMRIYCPVGLYEFFGTINFPGRQSFRVEGGGGMAKGLTNLQNARGAFTLWRWTGGAAGPMIHFDQSDGIVFSGINLDGGNNHNPSNPGTNLQDLIIWGDEGRGLFHHFSDMSLYRAQRLFRTMQGALSASVGGGPADITFTKVLFNTGAVGAKNWDAVAFRGENRQTVNIGFHACEWNGCPVCISCGDGGQGASGRTTVLDATVSVSGYLLELDGQGQNVNGHVVEGVHIDMDFPRLKLYRSRRSDRTSGHARFANIKWGTSAQTDTKEFVQVTGYSGNSLTIANPLRVRLFDRVGFVDNNNRDVLLDETVVTARNGFFNFTVQDQIGALAPGVQSAFNTGTLRAIDGEAIFTCVSSDQILLENSTITAQTIQGQRLARMDASTVFGGRNPVLHVRDCDGFQASGFGPAALEQLLRRTGTTFFLFENVAPIGIQNVAPIIHGNYGIGLLESGGGSNGGGGGNTPALENEMHIMTKYNQTRAIPIVLRDPATGDPKAGLSFTSADVIISKDGASPVTLGNVPAGSGSGIYLLLVSGSHTNVSQAKIVIKDQSSPAAFLPLTIHLETYGSVNAQHEMDFDVATINLPDGGLTADKIAASAITADKIADDALTTSKFKSEPITVPALGATAARLPEMVNLGTINHANPRMSGTTFEARRPDGAVLRTYTVNDATNPTEKVESS